VENNLIVNCARGIGFGLTTDAIDGHGRGIIRRNVIVADIPQYDSGIGLAKATDVRVLHNTVAETDRARNAFTSIDIRFSGSSGLVANNLVEGIRFRDGGAAWLRGNIDSFPLGWLRAPARGDVHLRRGVNAINSGVMVARAGRDLDGTARPRGRPDVGADERGGRG
jgi:hypothetical protein